MGKTLVKTIDGSYFLLGGKTRGFKVPKVLPELALFDAEEVKEEPPPPPKKKKVKKFHYTKPWEGTYGKFLEMFGNIYTHKPMDVETFGLDIELGNIYLRYRPETEDTTWSAYHLDENKLYITKWNVGGKKITPTAGLKNIRQVYQKLLNNIQSDKNAGRFIPWIEEPEEEVKPEPEEHKDTRGCEDPTCSWCHPQAKKTPTTGMWCPLCRNSYHNWDNCPTHKVYDLLPHTQNDWTTEFCDRCGDINHATEDCDFVSPVYCPTCGKTHMPDDCQVNKVAKSSMGNIMTAPWVDRGITVNLAEEYRANSPIDQTTPVEALWPIDNMDWDPLTANANLILLEFVAGNGRNVTPDIDLPNRTELLRRAQSLLDDLLNYIDPRLQAYTDMVVGGELRHHRAVGGTALPGPHQRPQAWKAWKQLRKIVGSQALLDAVVLFEDFGGGSFGGMKWAVPCKLLWMRETGKISPLIFCDKIFDLQHNGGSLLNKVAWKRNRRGESIELIKNWLGPARAMDPPDWPAICWFADEEVVRLFREYWGLSNRYARLSGFEQEEIPRPRYCDSSVSYRPAKKLKKVKVGSMQGGIYSGDLWDFNLPYLDKAIQDRMFGDLTCPVDGGSGSYYCEHSGGCLTAPNGIHEPDQLHFCGSQMYNCDSCGVYMCPLHEFTQCEGCDDGNANTNPHYVGKKSVPAKYLNASNSTYNTNWTVMSTSSVDYSNNPKEF